MRPTGIRAFDSTIHTTNVWLNDLMDRWAGRISSEPTRHCAWSFMPCAII